MQSEIKKIAKLISDKGGRCFIVGGYVRDKIFTGQTSKDVDMEVFGLQYDQVVDALSDYDLQLVGKSFGVIKMQSGGIDFDIALPRTEISTGVGHTSFDVHVDPCISVDEAVKRRDFTMNALLLDPITDEIIDPTGGLNDIHNGVLNITTDKSFQDDALRIMRAFQFVSRFDVKPSEKLIESARKYSGGLDYISKERMWTEWYKWSLSPKPDVGLQFLKDIDALPDIMKRMAETPQNTTWHPEGDVLEHTMQVVRSAAWIAKHEGFSKTDTSTLVFAALCHDFGKPGVTRKIEGVTRALGHEEAGVEPMKDFMHSIASPHDLIAKLVPLVKHHLYYASSRGREPTNKMIRKLSVKLQPSNINMWYRLVSADCTGRSVHPVNNNMEFPPYEIKSISETWLNKAVQMDIEKDIPKPIITGKMLIEIGVEPGPGMGVILKEYYQQQLNGEMSHINEILNTLNSEGPSL